MKFYGTRVCPDCIEAENVLKQANVSYEYVDITASTDNLKEFLDLRDFRAEFIMPKNGGFIGLPCFLMEDDSIYFDENKVIEIVEERLRAESELEDTISA